MRKHGLLILIAVAIIFHLATLSDAAVIKSDLVRRAQDSPYRPYGIYNYAYKNKKKKKHKNKDKDNDYKRHINKRDADPEEVKKRAVSVSTGPVDSSKLFTPGATNP